MPPERALGVHWDVNHDTFGFVVRSTAAPPTRRGILSTIASVYDPFGMLAPFVLIAKSVLQSLCKHPELGWDDDIPDEYLSLWIQWYNQLPLISSLSMSRCLKPSHSCPGSDIEIHVFCDASTIGYGVVAYSRFVHSSDDVAHCSFLMGKARVAPRKCVTVPRLELTAASVAARMGYALGRELRVDSIRVWYHTDSTVVLSYIANTSKRFQVFVANRVQTITELTKVENWRHIDAKSNPADLASRGSSDIDALNASWLSAPKFLSLPKTSWPGEIARQVA